MHSAPLPFMAATLLSTKEPRPRRTLLLTSQRSKPFPFHRPSSTIIVTSLFALISSTYKETPSSTRSPGTLAIEPAPLSLTDHIKRFSLNLHPSRPFMAPVASPFATSMPITSLNVFVTICFPSCWTSSRPTATLVKSSGPSVPSRSDSDRVFTVYRSSAFPASFCKVWLHTLCNA